MSRGPLIFGFWLLGYAIGFIVYLVRVPIISGFEYLLGSANADLVGAIVSGFAGSIVMLVILFVWSHWGSR
jgi:riboflavin transporter FmnP